MASENEIRTERGARHSGIAAATVQRVLASAIDAARRHAAIADDARSAGQACEAIHDGQVKAWKAPLNPSVLPLCVVAGAGIEPATLL